MIVAGMNLMGYDAMALGPLDLTLGPQTLRKRMAEADFPMLSANTTLEADGQLLARPYAILSLGDHRLGVLGLTRLPDEPVPGFDVLEPQVAAERYLPELARQADTIVVLTNLDFRSAQALAGAVPGIDLVVAGLPESLPDGAVRAAGSGALVVTSDPPSPGHTGRWVGRLAVTLEGDGRLTGESWTAVPLDNGVPDDPQMQALVGRYRQ